MKTELKAKFLQHLISKKKNNEGFTLIELLVVIIIIGILAAIALPSFLNQANKARQSEAQTYTGSVNRGQQAYYLQQSRFAANLSELELGIPVSTTYYSYQVAGGGVGSTQAQFYANALSTTKLRSYQGLTYLGTAGGNATTLAKICEGNPDGTPANGITCTTT